VSHDDLKLRLAQRAHDELAESTKHANEATVRSGELAMKLVILANGGAVVAVLAFLGSISSNNKVTAAQLATVANSLIWFAAGVAAGLACTLLAYLTNLHHAGLGSSYERIWEHPYHKDGPSTCRYQILGNLFMGLAIVCGAAALFLFVGGVLDVRSAILRMAATLAN
jgi:hypothetical protein